MVIIVVMVPNDDDTISSFLVRKGSFHPFSWTHITCLSMIPSILVVLTFFFFFSPPPGGRMMMQIMSLMVLSRDRIFCIGPIIARGHHFPKSASSNFMPIGVPIVNISRIIISNLRHKPNKYWNNICPHNYSPRRNSGMEFMP